MSANQGQSTPPVVDLIQNKDFLYPFRQALLMMVDAIEVALGITPTTAEIRRMYKNRVKEDKGTK